MRRFRATDSGMALSFPPQVDVAGVSLLHADYLEAVPSTIALHFLAYCTAAERPMCAGLVDASQTCSTCLLSSIESGALRDLARAAEAVAVCSASGPRKRAFTTGMCVRLPDLRARLIAAFAFAPAPCASGPVGADGAVGSWRAPR